ncbi:alpha/beta fold hydrolase [Agreia sp. Leaf210]|uniref:alpha/beta fold hydrolase n=1 Tax=Agreia sp. Leaf210 TaxID=1735682 RepID=UPI0006F99BBC|nr:alpha/beta hydrolase [Agreia sp. Leaf210]KQM58738.1 hydrolase [Agreia sp. Leaf210]
MIVPSPYAARLDAIPLERRTEELAGSTTELWVYGPHDADTTIVLVHGFRGDHHGLEPVVAHLPQYRTVVADLPGFGVSTPLDAGHDIEGYAAWLLELVDRVRGPGRTVVLGHSFGSIIVSAALARGLRVDDIVLVNPIAAPALSGPRGILTRLAVFYYWAPAKLPERLGFAVLQAPIVTRIMSVTMAKTRSRSLRRWIHNQHDLYFGAFSNRQVVLDAFKASISHDVSEYASENRTRTLLIAADRDDITPVEAQHRLTEKIADSRLVILTGVGHLVHYERPEQAADAIAAFLRDETGGR